MQDFDIDQYTKLMQEIKQRMDVVRFFGNGSGYAVYKIPTIETMCLQVRKILETIAMASLVANRKVYCEVYANFSKEWNAGELLKRLEKLNPDFYPHPLNEVLSEKDDVRRGLVDRENDYLTKKEFVEVYGRCGVIAHQQNPFGTKIDYGYYEENIKNWYLRILNLLSIHGIRLFGDENLYVVHMTEKRDDRVHFYVMEPVPHVQELK